jgi:hypothetical protein
MKLEAASFALDSQRPRKRRAGSRRFRPKGTLLTPRSPREPSTRWPQRFKPPVWLTP